ncbi:MAG: hypothetical protein P8017_18615, partial [Deltaproteobacteria bacterium]
LLGLPIMWLLLRTRLAAQESRQAEAAQQLQEVLLAKERLEAEAGRVPQLEEESKTLQVEKVDLVAKLAALETTFLTVLSAQPLIFTKVAISMPFL